MLARASKAGLIVLAALVTVLAAERAEAQQQTCTNDSDCPNAACGGEVCIKSSGLAFCYPANTQGASGTNDGWCADATGNPVDANCKCRGMGATCNGLYCTFTVPPGGTGGTGGSTGTGGSGAGGTSGGGDSGCSVAGAPALGGVAVAGIGLMLAALVMGRARRRG
jgi:hypothetical protein